MGWFSILFFLAVSTPMQAQTSSIADMIRIEANCFIMGSEEFIVEEPEDNPLGPTTGQFFILRGGSFEDEAFFLQSASRYWYPPTLKHYNIGFRCAANPPDTGGPQ